MAGSRKKKKDTFFLTSTWSNGEVFLFLPHNCRITIKLFLSFFLSAASDGNQGLIGKWSGEEGKELEVFPPPDLWRQPSGRGKERERDREPFFFLPQLYK